ncbi:MAG TPA: DUF1289 domain-containing protein [Burkholderiaceae bacterium]|jgi:hypothetical protein|nr:DUF1289 domain-containing protein [Burkholderiaceae bacterium]
MDEFSARCAAVAALPRGARVPSPCVDVCQIAPESGHCQGCRRTLDEIVVWGQMHDEDKREIWALLALRPPSE